MREDAASKKQEMESSRLKKIENQVKAKEYAKKQREIITKGKTTSASGSTTNPSDKQLKAGFSENLENDSPNVGAHTHTHIVNIQSPEPLPGKSRLPQKK